MAADPQTLLAAVKCFECYAGSAAQLQLLKLALLKAILDAVSTQPRNDLAVSTFAGLLNTPGSLDGQGAAARFDEPYGIKCGPDGCVFVADSVNSTIRKITPDGVVSTFAGLAGVTGSTNGQGAAARFNNPFGVAVDNAGYVYVADTGNSIIRMITPGGLVSTLAGTALAIGFTDGIGAAARFNSPYGLAADNMGNLFVGDSGNSTIRKIVIATANVTTFAGTAGAPGSADGIGAAARFNGTRGISADNSGNVFVADGANSTIRQVNTFTAQVTTLAGLALNPGSADGIGPAARFNGARGVGADFFGNVYVGDGGNFLIRKIKVATREVTTIAGQLGISARVDGLASLSEFVAPRGVGADMFGNVYVADYTGQIIRKIFLVTLPTTGNGVLAAANCLLCYAGTPGLLALVKLAVLARMAALEDATAPTDPKTLLGEAKCFHCYGTPYLLSLLDVALLSAIADYRDVAHATDPAALLKSANCFDCYGGGPVLLLAIEVQLWIQLMRLLSAEAGNNPSATLVPQTLLAEAKCYACYPQFDLLETALLSRIATSTGALGSTGQDRGDGSGDPHTNEARGGEQPFMQTDLSFRD